MVQHVLSNIPEFVLEIERETPTIYLNTDISGQVSEVFLTPTVRRWSEDLLLQRQLREVIDMDDVLGNRYFDEFLEGKSNELVGWGVLTSQTMRERAHFSMKRIEERMVVKAIPAQFLGDTTAPEGDIEFMGSLMDSLPLQIAILDEQRRFIYLNKTGIITEEERLRALGKTNTEFFAGHPLEHLAENREKQITQVISTKQPVEFIERYTLEAGKMVHYLRMVFPLFVESTGRWFIITYGVDISHLTAAEEKLERALQEEKRLGKIRNDMLELISHQLRTPLTMISSAEQLLSLVLDSNHLNSKTMKTVTGGINEGIIRLQEITEQLESLGADSVIDQDVTPLKKINPKTVIEEILEKFASRVTFDLKVDGPDCIYLLEEDTWKKSIISILKNAMMYRSGNTKVKVHLLCENTGVKVTIENKGLGIPSAETESVFNPFFRGSNVRFEFGVGLSLHKVKMYTERSGGSIEFSSIQNGKTSFSLYLPAKCLR